MEQAFDTLCTRSKPHHIEIKMFRKTLGSTIMKNFDLNENKKLGYKVVGLKFISVPLSKRNTGFFPLPFRISHFRLHYKISRDPAIICQEQKESPPLVLPTTNE